MTFGDFVDSKLSRDYDKINSELGRMGKRAGRKFNAKR
jgi:hypothetical protein